MYNIILRDSDKDVIQILKVPQRLVFTSGASTPIDLSSFSGCKKKRDNFIAGDQNALGYKALNGSSVSQRGDSTVDLAHHWSGGGVFRSVESIHHDAQQHTYSSKT